MKLSLRETCRLVIPTPQYFETVFRSLWPCDVECGQSTARKGGAFQDSFSPTVRAFSAHRNVGLRIIRTAQSTVLGRCLPVLRKRRAHVTKSGRRGIDSCFIAKRYRWSERARKYHVALYQALAGFSELLRKPFHCRENVTWPLNRRP